MLTDWLTDMDLLPASPSAQVDRDEGFQEEVRNSARALVEAVRLSRAGQYPRADRAIRDPRPN
jgi:hypothetical protein